MTDTERPMLGEAALALVMANRAALLAQAPGEGLLADEAQLRAALRVLNGEAAGTDGDGRVLLKDRAIRHILSHEERLFALPGFGLTQLAYWFSPAHPDYDVWGDDIFQSWLARADLSRLDPVMIDAALTRAGNQPDIVALACLRDDHGLDPRPQDLFSPAQVWPLFARDTQWLEQGLGLATVASRRVRLDLDAVLQVLGASAQLEQRWLPPLIRLARGDDARQRDAAQRLLATVPGMWQTAAQDLASGKQEERSAAARWLGVLQDRAAVPALHQALARESRETVSAVLLGVLENLGEDLRPRLSPAALLAEARKGLRAKAPAGLAWFSFGALPDCRWQDGGEVERDIVRWWVVLACKLKAPGGNALLARYVMLLDRDSREALAGAVLQQFIAHDTATPSLDEATAHALACIDRAMDANEQLSRLDTDHYLYEAPCTRGEKLDELKRDKLSQYLGSAMGEKGVLALAFAAPGQQAVSLLKQYMRWHPQRRGQLEAMLEALAPGAAPAVMQLLLGIAQRYKAASVQKKARLLVEQVAAHRGWSADQLAERSMPSGGLDENGELVLDYGRSVFVARLDGALKLQLFDANSQPLAALPAPRQEDREELAREAKQQLALCKQDILQVQAALASQLYRAMCLDRCWPADEWRDVFLRHPLANRLVQQVLWQEVAPDGQLLRIVRPVEDGSLIDAQDDAVTLAPDMRLRVAHAALMDDAHIACWQRHLADYRIKPLFDQLARRAVPAALLDGEEIAERRGWLGDTFRLRSVFRRLAYDPGPSEGGAIFTSYRKELGGMEAVIGFSGSALPEQLHPAALTTLHFHRLEGPRRYRPVALAQVPPVLLAEAYADYLEAAAACDGHDKDWRRKLPC